MKTGFLIVNYNDAETTITLLNNIKDYDVLDFIVVVDNKSTDDSINQLAPYLSKKLHVISNVSNKGYGSAINLGCKYLVDQLDECKIIVSNSDIVIYSEEDLEKLLNNIPDDAGIVAPIVKEHNGLNRGWKVPTPTQDAWLNLIGLEKLLRPKWLNYEDSHYKSDIVPVEALSGCFFIIDSEALREAGYYDENIFLYYEEYTMARKMEEINKKTYINTTVEVFHNHSVSINKSINRTGKFRELKKSQKYFQAHYNSASMLGQVGLVLSEEFSFFFLKFLYLFK